MTFEEARINEIEEALKFLGEGDGRSLTLESDGNGYGQMVIRDILGDVLGTASNRNLTYTGMLLVAYSQAKKKLQSWEQ